MTDEEIKEMIECLKANMLLIDMAIEEKEEGNYFKAEKLVRQYDEMVADDIEYWGVSYEWAVNAGLVVNTKDFI